MKKILVIIFTASLALSTAETLKANVLADWTFQTSVSTNNIVGTGKTPSATQSGIAADIGSGTASASHATAGTVWSIPSGNGSTNSWSANNWTANDFYQLAVSSVGFSGLTLSYDQTGSATGPSHFYLAYSTDGSSFTVFGGTNSLLVNGAPNFTWNTTVTTNGYNFSYNLSSVTALDNVSAVYFRLVDADAIALNGGVVATAGTDRIDNFIVNANPVPEPSIATLAALGGFMALGCISGRRRSK